GEPAVERLERIRGGDLGPTREAHLEEPVELEGMRAASRRETELVAVNEPVDHRRAPPAEEDLGEEHQRGEAGIARAEAPVGDLDAWRGRGQPKRDSTLPRLRHPPHARFGRSRARSKAAVTSADHLDRL